MMRLKTLVLCSSSAAILAVSSPALAQSTTEPGPAQNPPVQTEDVPNDPDAAAPQQDDAVEGEEEEIVITGLRRSIQSAQAIKRNSDQIVDAIVAEDIGKLPDVAVSDTAARIPGVQVNRSNGEANQVLVRGLPDVTTTYNGREIFTAETRFVALQDFPAGGISALEVYKSTTANLIEGGLAGLINVRSRRPFDFTGLEVAGALRYAYAEQSGKGDPNGNLLVSNRWETGIGEIGALINLSYTRLRFLDSARFNGGFIEQGVAEAGSPGTFRRARGEAGERDRANNIRFPDAVGIFYGAGDRTRPSANAALQWKPNANLQFYVDGLYQGFRNKGSDRRLFVPVFGDARLTNVTFQDTNGAVAVQSLTANNQVAPFLFQGAAYGKTDTYQVAVGGIYDAGPFRISADIARTDSRFDLSVYSFDFAFNRAPTVNVDFDVPRGDGGVEFSFDNFDTNDPANYRAVGLFDRKLVAEGDDYQYRTDLQYETGFSFVPEVQFGLRYVDRDGHFENGERFRNFPDNTPLGRVGLDLQVIRGGFRGDDVQPTRTFVSPTRRSIRDNIADLRTLAGFAPGTPPIDPSGAFDANEKTYTAYGQIKYDFSDRFPVDGIIGLRAINVKLDLAGTNRLFVPGQPDQLVPTTNENSSTDYLPNASARIMFSERLQLRLAATQTRTRPGFNQLNPASFVDPPPDCARAGDTSPSCFRRARSGNIDLQPVESNNYDASLEYYFSRTGFAALAFFRRDLNGFIFNFETATINDPTFGPTRFNRPENAGEGRLEGIEAQFTTFFDYDFLPEFAKGFGIQANATYIKGEQAVPLLLGADVPDLQAIPGISKYSYNLVGLYERGGVSARLAYNYRSQFANFFDGSQDGQFAGEFTRGISRLDFSASYTPFENITLAVDVSNILAKPFRNFRNFNSQEENFPRDVRFEERIFSFGARFRL